METSNEPLQKLAVGTKHGLVGSIGGRIFSVLGDVLAARILGPAMFGLYEIGWTLLRFVSLFMPLGMDRGFLRYGPSLWKKDEEGLKGLILQVILIAFISGLTLGIALFFISPWLSTAVYKKPELETVFKLFSLVFPFLSVLIVVAAITRMTQNIKYSVILQDLGQPIAGLILMVIFYILGLKLIGIIYSDLLSIALACIFGLWIIRKIFPELQGCSIKFRIAVNELFRYSLPATFGGAFSVYIFWIDRILVGYFCSPFENGIYLAGSQISTLFVVIISGINGIVVPIFSDLFIKNDFKKIDEIYKVSTKWSFYLSAPFLALLIISPGDILSVIYGEPYRIGAGIILILLFGQAINLITGSVNPLLGMTGNQNFLFNLSAIIFLCDIAMNVILIPKLGLAGAAISTSLSVSLLYIIAVIWVKKKLKLWPYDRRYYKGILAFFICLTMTWGISLLYKGIPLLNIIIQLLVALFSFSSTLLLLKLDDEDKAFLSHLFPKGHK